MDPVPTFNWVFKNQPIASGILTQLSRYKRADSNLLADEKGPRHLGQVVVRLCIYTYTLINPATKLKTLQKNMSDNISSCNM